MGRIAGLDYGKARIGLAISDERGIIAQPQPFIHAGKSLEETAKNIAAALAKHGKLEAIVIGLPLHLSGKDSPMSLEVRKLAELLEALCQVPVALWDERLTTAQVEKEMKSDNIRRKKRAPLIDSLSATLILQNFLDRGTRI